MRRACILTTASLFALAGCVGTLGGEALAPSERIELRDGGPTEPPPRSGGESSGTRPEPPRTDASGGVSPIEDMCGDIRMSAAVYYGTLDPTFLPMSPGQVLAVADLNGCSGLLINDQWVLTAEHCSVRRGSEVCFGSDPRNADVCFRAVSAHNGPRGADIALLDLGESVSARLPDIRPVAILMEDLDASTVGTTAEAAGYGTMEDGRVGTRKFTAQPIVSVRGDNLTIDGEGRRGVCFGDSGGPVMILAGDGSIRTAGVLSHGDSSCVGRDNYTRVDNHRDWIIDLTGAPRVEEPGCGEVTVEGRCIDERAVYCGGGDRVQMDTCAGSDVCGWSEAERGYRCVPGETEGGGGGCGGVDAYGVCDGSLARWCDEGVLRQRDCGACGQTCGAVASVGGVYCIDDPCMGLDYHGICEGDVAVYCRDGEVRRVDCSDRGQSCGWVNGELGNFCR